MRTAPILAALLALVLAAPAEADVTARFRQTDGRPMVVEVNDFGESRMTVSNAVYVTTGGVMYMILNDSQGIFVVRQQDFMALMAELLGVSGPNEASTGGDRVTILQAGSETLAGRAGTVFRLGAPQHPADSLELVISADPELAPLGPAMAAHIAPFFETMSGAMPGVSAAVVELMARGTLIRLGDLWRLDSVEIAPVAPSAFALPSPPIDRAALAARLGTR